MPFEIAIPLIGGGSLNLSVDVGGTLFLLGANGTGKSSLMHRFYTSFAADARKISAHRQNWFQSNAMSISAEQRRATGENITGADSDFTARWLDHYAQHRPSIAIFDLINSENNRARKIAGAADAGNDALVKDLVKSEAPLKTINELLRLSNLSIKLMLEDGEKITASRNEGAPYGIAELSDGERNAILIAANVLTARAGAIILIDEPERHLHRSIISPLLGLLFARRDDCAFVVSTHDVMLAIDHDDAQTLLVRDCAYQNSIPQSWSADLLEGDAAIGEELRRDILGARRIIIFVEGTDNSLDKSLYSLIFPAVSIVPKGSCRDVEHVVAGVRSSSDLHWVSAYGIIDNDRRPGDEIAALKAAGVFAVSVYSVESIYYHPDIMNRVAARQEQLTGESAADRLAELPDIVINNVRPHASRLAIRTAEKAVRAEFFKNLPTRASVESGQPTVVEIDVAAFLAAEMAKLTTALDSADIKTIIENYPLRETPALGHIAMKLGFTGQMQYEKAVRKLLMDDEDALAFVRSLFEGLCDLVDITAAPNPTPETTSGVSEPA